MKFIQVRHEEAAAFAACGYAKYTGRLGLCLATSGPGGIHTLVSVTAQIEEPMTCDLRSWRRARRLLRCGMVVPQAGDALFIIGHSTRTLAEFVALLRQ
ncbi:MAG: thiamine pyrophosphate-binding protein, partial [Guyparkeria sp.]